MFETLVYMYSKYLEGNLQVDQSTLKQELCDAGFTSLDVEDALSWLLQLEEMSRQVFTMNDACNQDTGMRIYTSQELKKMSLDSINFLLLERSKVLGMEQRELAIDRAMTLPLREVGVEEMRWVVQYVLWSFDKSIGGQEILSQYVFAKNAIYSQEQQALH